MQDQPYDLLIIGGGINGCGIARDAAGRGLKVALAEMGDLAQGTSSASTKLIHGGLRYLEHYAFGLVREALEEREVLLNIAPHIVSPMRFVLPHGTGMRPAWMLRLGLFIYDHLGGRKILPATRTLDLRKDASGEALLPQFTRGYEYSDCWVDDARLVVLNAMDAARRGADIFVRTKVVSAQRDGDVWSIGISGEAGERFVATRALVDASGAWSRDLSSSLFASRARPPVRLVKGSHIVVPRMFAHARSYILQQKDGRIVFAIPYETDFTLIGTTDVDFAGDPLTAAASEEEMDYLLAAVKGYFRNTPSRADIIWSCSGVRALYDDGASAAKDATREYVLALDAVGPPVLHIYGGKITTYRRLAEAVLQKLHPFFPSTLMHAWTASAPLPGGDMPGGIEDLRRDYAARYPWLEAAMLARMLRSYGTLTAEILGDAASAADLGTDFGAGLTEREVRWLMQREWARTADDILWRRSKLGLRLDAVQRQALAAFVGDG